MRVSERKGCVLASKGSKECKPNIYTKQATPVPSGSILDKTLFCQFSIPKQTPPPLRGTPSNSEGDVHGVVHTISTTPPDLPYRRGGVLW